MVLHSHSLVGWHCCKARAVVTVGGKWQRSLNVVPVLTGLSNSFSLVFFLLLTGLIFQGTNYVNLKAILQKYSILKVPSLFIIKVQVVSKVVLAY